MMEKKLYITPTLKVHVITTLNRLMRPSVSDDEIGDYFDEGAKGGFFDENDNILPRGKNVWSDDF